VLFSVYQWLFCISNTDILCHFHSHPSSIIPTICAVYAVRCAVYRVTRLHRAGVPDSFVQLGLAKIHLTIPQRLSTSRSLLVDVFLSLSFVFSAVGSGIQALVGSYSPG
jgi:hypothetical protein